MPSGKQECIISQLPKFLLASSDACLQVHFHCSLTSLGEISSKRLKNVFLPLKDEFTILSFFTPWRCSTQEGEAGSVEDGSKLVSSFTMQFRGRAGRSHRFTCCIDRKASKPSMSYGDYRARWLSLACPCLSQGAPWEQRAWVTVAGKGGFDYPQERTVDFPKWKCLT